MDEDDANMHYCKGFLTSDPGTIAVRGADENLRYEQTTHLHDALNHVDGLSAPPTESDGDVYLLQQSTVIHDVDTIVLQSGITKRVRLTFNGSPDLSGIVAGDRARVRTATFSPNNGTFVITDVNDVSDYIDITNIFRATGDGFDEATDSPATTTTTHRDWDGAGDGDHVQFFAGETLWYGLTPLPVVDPPITDRIIVWDRTANRFRVSTTDGWVFYTVENATNTDNMTKIFMSNNYN
jgi:hypothetical protein